MLAGKARIAGDVREAPEGPRDVARHVVLVVGGAALPGRRLLAVGRATLPRELEAGVAISFAFARAAGMTLERYSSSVRAADGYRSVSTGTEKVSMSHITWP